MTKTVTVTATVEVTVDETKFTSEFLQEFRDNFYSFDTIDDHIESLARQRVVGDIEASRYNKVEFIEGYGFASDMGIILSEPSLDSEIEQ